VIKIVNPVKTVDMLEVVADSMAGKPPSMPKAIFVWGSNSKERISTLVSLKKAVERGDPHIVVIMVLRSEIRISKRGSHVNQAYAKRLAFRGMSKRVAKKMEMFVIVYAIPAGWERNKEQWKGFICDRLHDVSLRFNPYDYTMAVTFRPETSLMPTQP
jgi:hypothetical protein